MVTYAYYPFKAVRCGDNWDWTEKVVPGRWYNIRIYVKINSAGQHDGVAAAWLNGTLVLNDTKVLYRYVDTMDYAVTIAYITTYVGGSDVALFAPNHTQTALFDNFMVWEGRCDAPDNATAGTGPASPASPPSKPASPVSPERPAIPAGPAKPESPAGPAGPSGPAGPAGPASPAVPANIPSACHDPSTVPITATIVPNKLFYGGFCAQIILQNEDKADDCRSWKVSLRFSPELTGVHIWGLLPVASAPGCYVNYPHLQTVAAGGRLTTYVPGFCAYWADDRRAGTASEAVDAVRAIVC